MQSFYKGVFGDKVFKLIGVSDIFSQKTYDSLAPEERRFLNDAILHATIFQQVEPSNDRSSVYSIFERLNTGGTPLSPQEIRACVYRGSLNDLLSELADNPHWEHLYGKKDARKKNEEIILRFFALFFCLETYDRPMKKFLNEFMEENRELDTCRIQEFRKVFQETVEAADTILRPAALRPERALNVSVADAVLVGLAHRLREGPVSDHQALLSAHNALITKLRDERLHIEDTTNKERVNTRIAHARQAYGAVH